MRYFDSSPSWLGQSDNHHVGGSAMTLFLLCFLKSGVPLVGQSIGATESFRQGLNDANEPHQTSCAGNLGTDF